jgi:nucleolar protein 56
MVNYLLFEDATGYALFDVVEAEDIGSALEKVQQSVTELKRFGKMVKVKAFVPFKSAEEALSNINDITEGACHSPSACDGELRHGRSGMMR